MYTLRLIARMMHDQLKSTWQVNYLWYKFGNNIDRIDAVMFLYTRSQWDSEKMRHYPANDPAPRPTINMLLDCRAFGRQCRGLN